MSWKIPMTMLALRKQGSELVPVLHSSKGCSSAFNKSDGTLRGLRTTQGLPQRWMTDIDRANASYLAFAISVSSVESSLIHGIDLDDLSVSGFMALYEFLWNTYVFQGYRKFVSYMKYLKNYCLAMSLESKTALPQPPSGLRIPKTVAGFSWAMSGILRKKFVQCRSTSSGDVAHNYFQIYLIGKALAVPGSDKIRSAMEQHQADYSRIWGRTPELEKLAQEWSKSWITHCLSKRKEVNGFTVKTHFGPASSITSKRSDGGKDADASEVLGPYREEHFEIPESIKCDLLSAFGELKVDANLLLTVPVVDGFRKFPNRFFYLSKEEAKNGFNNDQLLARDLALARLANKGYVPPASNIGVIGPDGYLGFYIKNFEHIGVASYKGKTRTVELTCVLERGDKARIVNISEWEVTILGQFVRDYLYQITSTDEEIPALRGSSPAAGYISKLKRDVQELLGVKGSDVLTEAQQAVLLNLEFLSLDLSRCSDLILACLSDSFLEGALQASPAKDNPFMRRVWHICQSQRFLVYRDHEDLNILDNRAPAMGDPPTWWIDNAYTKFASMLAMKLSDLGKIPNEEVPLTPEGLEKAILSLTKRERKFDFTRPSLAGRSGDDEVRLSTPKHNKAIAGMYSSIGGKVSEGTNIRSDGYAVFCENHLERSVMTDCHTVVDWLDLLRTKSLIPSEARRPGEQARPAFWTRGSAASTALAWWPEGSEEASLTRWIIVHENFFQIEHAYKLGLQVFASGKLGGLDYPAKLETVWNRANQSTRNLWKLLAASNSVEMDWSPLNVVRVEQLASIFSGSVHTNPYAEQDRRVIETVFDSLDHDGSILSLTTLASYAGLSSEEYPACKWKDYKKTFFVTPNRGSIEGARRRFLNVSGAAAIARTRLIMNRGMATFLDSKPSLQTNERAAALYYSTVKELTVKLTEALSHCDVEVESLSGVSCIHGAIKAVDLQTQCHFVDIDQLDSLIPDLVKHLVIE